MGRFTQQQLRAVLRADPCEEYVVCCPAGADVSLIHPEILAAPNAAIRFLPAAISCVSPLPDGGDDTLERAELFQDWIERSKIDLFHAATPMIASEPVLAGFDACPLVATLYDLIPLVFPDRYLSRNVDRDDYMRALSLMMRAHRLIAISESARNDAVNYLGMPPARIDVAYPVAEPAFRPVDRVTSDARLRTLRRSRRIPEHFVLAVTHFHHSKNVGLLLGAYGLLPPELRRQLPMVLCCDLDTPTESRMHAMTGTLGIAEDVIVTGMVSDDELAALYGQATVVVHPSRYEGFGLPVVEAMACGTPVITTTSSSLPEVAGDAALLVDPDDARALADAITEVCTDTDLRREMSRRGVANAWRFSAEQLGMSTLDSYRRASDAPVLASVEGRLRIALWTPVPPQQSGIADYSAELVDQLSASCDIEVFVDGGFTPEPGMAQKHDLHHFSAFERRNRRAPFDLIVYQMGNSHFHSYMYDAVRRHPGIVVLHDMAWSQVLFAHMQQRDGLAAFVSELAEVEGEDAAREFTDLDRLTPSVRDRARLEFLDRHPMLGGLVEGSLAQVVLLDACLQELLRRHPNARPSVIEMGVADPYGHRPQVEVGAARARLGVPADTFLVGTFGIVHPVKRIEACLRAVARLLPSVPHILLLVVGRMAGAEYEAHLRDVAAQLGVEDHVRFTGHVSREELDAHLVATDVVVNLRTPTHLHMSAIICRAAAAGKPVIISDLPGWAFLSEPCFVRVPVDDSEVDVLSGALAEMADDAALRQRLAVAARARFSLRGSSQHMAAHYLRLFRAVEDRRLTGRRAAS